MDDTSSCKVDKLEAALCPFYSIVQRDFWHSLYFSEVLLCLDLNFVTIGFVAVSSIAALFIRSLLSMYIMHSVVALVYCKIICPRYTYCISLGRRELH